MIKVRLHRTLAASLIGAAVLTISAGSASAATAPPQVPTNLLAVGPVAAGTDIQLSWTAADLGAGENAPTRFDIDRCAGIGCTNFGPLFSVAAPTTSVVDSTPKLETTVYNYRVRAANSAGVSESSNVSGAYTSWNVPTAPSNLTATFTNAGVTARWTDNSTNETGFYLIRCETWFCPDSSPVVRVGPNVTTWTDSTALAGTTYVYQVYAVRNTAKSTLSNSVQVATGTGISGVTNLRASASRTSIRLTWRPSQQAEVEVWRCDANCAQGAANPSWQLIALLPAGTTRFVDADVISGTTYVYGVRLNSTTAVSPLSRVTVTVRL